MKTRFLFPYWCRFLGYASLLLTIPFYVINQDTYFRAIIILLIMGFILVAFSKERIEDEQISQLRLDALQWAIYANYLVLLISIATYGGNNLREVYHFDLKFTLLIFILRFRWVIFRLNRTGMKEAKLS